MRVFKVLLALLTLSIFIACSEDEDPSASVSVPQQFSVDIPPSLSSAAATGISGREGDSDEVIEGEDIYEALRYYIHLGEQSAEILEITLIIASAFEQGNVVAISFVSDDDQREKRIDLVENVTRGGNDYQYEMTMVDTENEDLALQLLWNTEPVEGIAILNPYNLDRSDEEATQDAFYRIDYTEDHPDYEQAMTVSISGAEVEENGDIDNLKMFAGRNGDIVEVMGNSNHPNINIIDPDFIGGRNYAFVARGDEVSDVAVVNLWLPPSDVSTNDFDAGDEYSVFSVLEAEINAVTDGFFTEEEIASILSEANSPAYFNSSGFITSGVDNKPASFSDTFVDLTGMTPFVPNDIQNLAVDFIQ